MARPTSLRILGERTVLPDVNPDNRTAEEAFGSTDHTLDENVLAILRRNNERIEGEVTQARAVSETASSNANLAVQEAIAAKTIATSLSERQVNTEAALQKAVAHISTTNVETRQAATMVTVGLLHKTLAMFGTLISFLVDRAPALFAFVAGYFLWQNTLADPSTMKLIGLGLFAIGIVAPATWLASRRMS